ncbi:hypothetical protein Hypma_016407 [Hypsizygus marmoreus]|uniref:F-box domain-containing protein n=1 Tax=Hypsizygus marmoreus TaxID=39966 RepID=A0A369IYK8_HYPMA|nr:hypothetical protein Hypma_016407 [Hypsizygus marmoreus]
MAIFTSLPPELIEQILLLLDPLQVACVAQCCQLLRSLVYGSKDQALWRELYLEQPFDDPRECVSLQGTPRIEVDWRGELQRFIRARTIVHDVSLCRPGERLEILNTLLDMVSYVPPLSSPHDNMNISRNLLWVAAMLHGGAFLDDASAETPEEKRVSARLHTYFGLTHNDARRATRVRSRAYVYDMRNYQPDYDYGPFDAKGCVDWVHVQALHHVVSMHIVDLQEDQQFEFAIFPMSLPFTQIVEEVVVIEGEVVDTDDWAGVGGAWRVSFCFVDHRELLKYNESATSPGGPLDISIFESPDFGEVFRSLNVNLRVVKTVSDPKYPKRPVIYFAGEMPESTSTMTGHVRMTPDNQVRWHFVSGDQGSAVWSSQGVHIGGLKSSFGVLGAWTTVFHDSDDPVGPFWLRRESVSVNLPMNHLSLNTSIPT